MLLDMNRTFVERARAGELGTGEQLESAFADAVEQWHRSPTDDDTPMWQYLGFESFFEYGRTLTGESVDDVLDLHRPSAG